jgi:hypothetical protein
MLERPITNLADTSALAVSRCDQKIDQAIEWIIIVVATALKDTIRK